VEGRRRGRSGLLEYWKPGMPKYVRFLCAGITNETNTKVFCDNLQCGFHYAELVTVQP